VSLLREKAPDKVAQLTAAFERIDKDSDGAAAR
jgi:hypothetical protein